MVLDIETVKTHKPGGIVKSPNKSIQPTWRDLCSNEGPTEGGSRGENRNSAWRILDDATEKTALPGDKRWVGMFRKVGEEPCKEMGYTKPTHSQGKWSSPRVGNGGSGEKQGQIANVTPTFLWSLIAGKGFKPTRDWLHKCFRKLAMKALCKEDKKVGGWGWRRNKLSPSVCRSPERHDEAAGKQRQWEWWGEEGLENYFKGSINYWDPFPPLSPCHGLRAVFFLNLI